MRSPRSVHGGVNESVSGGSQVGGMRGLSVAESSFTGDAK